MFLYISYTFIHTVLIYLCISWFTKYSSFVLKYLLIYLLNKIFYLNKCVFISFNKVNDLITTEPS